jgi:hypothetical protein
MVQAGVGSDYAQETITTEIDNFLSRAEGGPLSPVIWWCASFQPECSDRLVYQREGYQ